jgi:hypothetical protein
VICVAVGISLFITWVRFYSFIKRTNYERWRELTTIGSFGPGAQNSWRALKYVYGDRDNDNENVLRYKDKIRIKLRYFGIFVLAIGVNSLLLLIIAKTVKG